MRDTIETDRLVLRQLRLTDAPNFCLYGGEYDVAKMTGSFPFPFPLLSVEVKIMMLKAQKRRGVAHPYAITHTNDELMAWRIYSNAQKRRIGSLVIGSRVRSGVRALSAKP